jgi:hypothetical protein
MRRFHPLARAAFVALACAGADAAACVGKWGLGMDDMPGAPWRQGFDLFFGYLDQVHAHNYFPDYVWRDRERVALPNEVRPIPVGKDGAWGLGGIATKKAVDSPALMLDEALAFIDRSKDRPFFLYFATTIPHANTGAAKELGNGAEAPDLGLYKDRPWPEPEKGYAAMVTYLDTQVGVLVRRLRDLDLDDRTLVTFAGHAGGRIDGMMVRGGPLVPKGLCEPLAFNALNVERKGTNPQSEIADCAHVRVYYFKVEAGTISRENGGDGNTPCRISNSNDIRIYCNCRVVRKLGDRPMLDVVDSTDVAVSLLKTLNAGTYPHIVETFRGARVVLPSSKPCALFVRGPAAGVRQARGDDGVWPEPAGVSKEARHRHGSCDACVGQPGPA